MTLLQLTDALISLLPTPLVGLEAAKTHLKQLGYHPGDTFFVKAGNNIPIKCIIAGDYGFSAVRLVAQKVQDFLLFPQEDQYVRDEAGRKIWLDGKTYEDGFGYLKNLSGERNFASNQPPKDIFIIPNFQNGGIRAEQTTGTFSLFLESDDGSFQEQLTQVEDFAEVTGLIPSLIVFSGGKSLHIYFRLSEFLADEPTRKRLQRKLVALFKSDIQIVNANREMRFAGFWRSGKQEYQSIVFSSPHEYSVEDFETRLDSLGRFPEGLDESRWATYVRQRNRKADDLALLRCLQEPTVIIPITPLPRPSSPILPTPHSPLPTPGGVIPLEHFLSESDRELLYSGMAAGQGGRNPTGFQLACKLAARQERLIALNIPYFGDPKQLLADFCARCNPPLEPPEIDRIWHNASHATRSRLEDSYFLEKYEAWVRRQNPQNYEQAKKSWEEEYEEQRREKSGYKFTREGDIVTKSGRFPDMTLADLAPGVNVIRGGCGSGKTTMITQMLQGWKGHVLQIGSLNSLLENTSKKFQLEHHKTLKEENSGTSAWEILSKTPRLAITDVSLAMHVNVQEVYKDLPLILILDEVEQTLESLTMNSNLSGALRLEARIRLEWLIKNATHAIASDADLSDATLDYLESVRGEGTRIKIFLHEGAAGEGRLPIRISTNKGSTLRRCVDAIASGYKAIIPCETKSDLKAIEKNLREKTPDASMLTIHGDNSCTEEIRPLIQEIDSEYLNYNVLAYTASLGTGIDLSVPHYDRRFGFLTSDVLAAPSQWQLLSRYRPDVLTELFVSNKKRRLEIDPDQIILKLLKRDADSAASITCSIKELLNIGLFPTPNREILECDRPFLKLWGAHQARKNASLANPLQSFIDRAEQAGYTIEILEEDEDQQQDGKINEKLHKEIKKEQRTEEYKMIAAAKLLCHEEYESLKTKPTNTIEERRRIEKTLLHNTFGIEVTPEVVELDRRANLSASMKLLHILTTHEDSAVSAEIRDRSRNPIISDRKYLLGQRELLIDLGITDFLTKMMEPGYEYSRESPEVITIAQKVRARSRDVKRILGFSISFEKKDGEFRQSGTEILGRIWRKLGIAVVDHKVKNKPRLYRLDQNRFEMISSILDHMEQKPTKPPTPEDAIFTWYYFEGFGEFRFFAAPCFPGIEFGLPEQVQPIVHKFTSEPENGSLSHLLIYKKRVSSPGSTTPVIYTKTGSGGTATMLTPSEVPPPGGLPPGGSSSRGLIGLSFLPEGSTTSHIYTKTGSGGTATMLTTSEVPPPGPAPKRGDNSSGGTSEKMNFGFTGMGEVPPLPPCGTTPFIYTPSASGGTAGNLTTTAVPPLDLDSLLERGTPPLPAITAQTLEQLITNQAPWVQIKRAR